MLLFFKWLCAHLLGDFVLQPASMVRHKREYKARSGYLYLHALIHAALVYLFTGWWTCWILPLVVGVTHLLIDLWKLYRKDTLFYFILDQALHLAVLGALWWWFEVPQRADVEEACRSVLQQPNFWIVSSSYIFVIWPCALVIGYLTRRWREVIEIRAPELADTTPVPNLAEAGKWIGWLERVLVLTFILTNHLEGIGFLIAAKSVLRFGDIKGPGGRAEAEYVLIGTLMSFSISILAGLLCRYLIAN
jgi:hypothetical protein